MIKTRFWSVLVVCGVMQLLFSPNFFYLGIVAAKHADFSAIVGFDRHLEHLIVGHQWCFVSTKLWRIQMLGPLLKESLLANPIVIFSLPFFLYSFRFVRTQLAPVLVLKKKIVFCLLMIIRSKTYLVFVARCITQSFW